MQSIGQQISLRRIAGPVAGILVLLAAILLATGLCSAAIVPAIAHIFKVEAAAPAIGQPDQIGNNDRNKSRSGRQKETAELQRHEGIVRMGDTKERTFAIRVAKAMGSPLGAR